MKAKKDKGKANESEASSPVLECHVPERPQPLIHIKAGVRFLAGILIGIGIFYFCIKRGR